jgi:tyrosinase
MFARVLWLLASIVLSCSRVHSSAVPINNPPRQATGPSVYPVLGVRGLGVVTTHPRLEIRELERNKDQLMSTYSDCSGYRICPRMTSSLIINLQVSFRLHTNTIHFCLDKLTSSGTHGRPFIPWDGVGRDPRGSNGYCAHGSNLFPTWHRPYLALVEVCFQHLKSRLLTDFQ